MQSKFNEQNADDIQKNKQEKDELLLTELPSLKETSENLSNKKNIVDKVISKESKQQKELAIQVNKGIQRILAIFQRYLKPCFEELLEKINWLCSREQTLERLSFSLRKYEEDFVSEKVLRPLFYDFILLYDSLCSAKKRLCEKNELFSMETSNVLEGLEIEVLQTLERYNVSLMSDTSRKFNSAKQKAVKIIYKEEPSETGEVMKITRRGFYIGKQVLRYEEVIIGKEKRRIENGKHESRD